MILVVKTKYTAEKKKDVIFLKFGFYKIMLTMNKLISAAYRMTISVS